MTLGRRGQRQPPAGPAWNTTCRGGEQPPARQQLFCRTQRAGPHLIGARSARQRPEVPQGDELGQVPAVQAN